MLRNPETDTDAWILYRAHHLLYLSAARFASGDKDRGYEALEECVRLCEIIFNLPVGTELSYNTPVLNLLKIRVTDKPPFGKEYLYISSAYHMNYPMLAGKNGWEWFTCVQDEERFKACAARIAKYKPEGFPE